MSTNKPHVSSSFFYLVGGDTAHLKVLLGGVVHFLSDILYCEITLHLCMLVQGISPDVSALAD